MKKRNKIAPICLALSTLAGFTEGNWIINLVVRCSTICYILAEDFHKWPCRIMLSSDVLSRACLVQCTDAISSTGSLHGPESVHDRYKVRNSFTPTCFRSSLNCVMYILSPPAGLNPFACEPAYFRQCLLPNDLRAPMVLKGLHIYKVNLIEKVS